MTALPQNLTPEQLAQAADAIGAAAHWRDLAADYENAANVIQAQIGRLDEIRHAAFMQIINEPFWKSSEADKFFAVLYVAICDRNKAALDLELCKQQMLQRAKDARLTAAHYQSQLESLTAPEALIPMGLSPNI